MIHNQIIDLNTLPINIQQATINQELQTPNLFHIIHAMLKEEQERPFGIDQLAHDILQVIEAASGRP